jgi:hypothetical protein
MMVKVDNSEYKVAVCENHEDSASPRAVKTMVVDKAKEIERLKEMAAKFGLKIQEQGAAETAPSAREVNPTAAEAKPAPAVSSAPPGNERNFAKGLKPQVIKREESKPISEAETESPADVSEMPAGEAPPAPAPISGVESHQSYQTEGDELKVTAKQDQIIQTSDGRPITVPRTLFDSEGGKTEIRITRGGGDAALQQRFKNMAEGSKGGAGPDFRNQYSVRDCTACNGTGVSRVDKSKSCPKCNGDGFFKG